MGHLGHLKEEYAELVERLEAGQVALPEPREEAARAARQEILEILYTPEEAALASRMPVRPSSLGFLSKRLKVAPRELETVLDRMADKGLILDIPNPETGKVSYLLAPPVVGFFEFSLMRLHDTIPKKRMAEALEAYVHGDDTFAREAFGTETVIGRTMVHPDALRDDQLPEILDWESATAVVENTDSRAVSICYCRHKAEHLGRDCDAPKELCLTMGKAAEFVVRRKFGRPVGRSEALELLHKAREYGLVHVADNVVNEPTYICNCCACCCGQIEAINEFGLHAVNPSGYQATYDAETCKGCSRCSRACPVGAISMMPKRQVANRKNRLTPVIDHDCCIGCGVCLKACRNDAMAMERRESPPRIPANSLERTLRMALERGRLPHLLFDRGAGLGSRFMNSALQALIRLPVADRIAASEQLRSRFVNHILKQVESTMGPAGS